MTKLYSVVPVSVENHTSKLPSMSNNIMYQVVTRSILAISAALLCACASQPPGTTPAAMVNASAVPAGDPGLDHYIAWIPLEQAQTATVAEAMTHISLRNAREQTSHDLCDGRLITGGNVIERHGPVATRTPASMGGRPAWYYRISQQPGLGGCNNGRDNYLYQALQARLPRWMRLSRAGTNDVLTRGLDNQTTISVQAAAYRPLPVRHQR